MEGGENRDGSSLTTDLIMGALSHGRSPKPPRTSCITGNFVLQQEPQEEHQGHHHVAHGVKYNRALRVAESRHVDEERQEGEERGREADDGHDSDEVAGECQLFMCEVHVGTRRRAVSHPHEGVAELGADLELAGTPEAVVPLDRDGRLGRVRAGQEVHGAGVGLVAVWEPESRREAVTSFQVLSL